MYAFSKVLNFCEAHFTNSVGLVQLMLLFFLTCPVPAAQACSMKSLCALWCQNKFALQRRSLTYSSCCILNFIGNATGRYEVCEGIEREKRRRLGGYKREGKIWKQTTTTTVTTATKTTVITTTAITENSKRKQTNQNKNKRQKKPNMHLWWQQKPYQR